MKKTVCDNCGSENARSYKYQVPPTRGFFFKDFCVACLQEFVLKNQVKLIEVQDSGAGPSGKRVICG